MKEFNHFKLINIERNDFVLGDKLLYKFGSSIYKNLKYRFDCMTPVGFCHVHKIFYRKPFGERFEIDLKEFE